MKITKKISVTVFCFAFVPILVLFLVILGNIESRDTKDKSFLVQSSANQVYANVQKSVELCNMSTQVFLNNVGLTSFIERVLSKEKIPVEDLMQYNREDIVSMERLVNSNPYLYAIHVYVDSEELMEMMPILYHTRRMKNQKIQQEEQLQSSWIFNYVDDMFRNAYVKPSEHIMSLTTKIPSYTYGNLGYVEVAVEMENVFPNLFDTKQESWACFIDKEGHAYYDENEQSRWVPYIDAVMDIAKTKDGEYKDKTQKISLHGDNLILCVKSIPELGGTYIEVLSLDVLSGAFSKMIWHYIGIFLAIMALLALVINYVVRTMVKRFYKIFQALKEVQGGNLDVVMPNCGTDELGELSDQIGIMLDKIRQLMKDNLNREILAKNSEIRALQNQINAHFIYNVLESVKMMAEIEEKYEIADAVTSLGILLRYSMKGLAKNVTLRQEIEYIQNYVALMNLRFDYEIYLSLNIPDLLWEQEIPKMSLQPIIENAITHGIEDLAEDTNIYIKGIVEKDVFVIEVSDQGKGMTEEEVKQLRERIQQDIDINVGKGKGIGLKNVQDRIQIHFGKEYGIQVASKLGCYTKVSVRIPITKRSFEPIFEPVQ